MLAPPFLFVFVICLKFTSRAGSFRYVMCGCVCVCVCVCGEGGGSGGREHSVVSDRPFFPAAALICLFVCTQRPSLVRSNRGETGGRRQVRCGLGRETGGQEARAGAFVLGAPSSQHPSCSAWPDSRQHAPEGAHGKRRKAGFLGVSRSCCGWTTCVAACAACRVCVSFIAPVPPSLPLRLLWSTSTASQFATQWYVCVE